MASLLYTTVTAERPRFALPAPAAYFSVVPAGITTTSRHTPAKPVVTPVNTERVLVVDDEPDIVALVAYHLAKAGYRVSTASTGPDALGRARQERPALVVLDLMLPGMSGYDVLEQLRADETHARRRACSCSRRAAKSRTASAASRSAPTTISRSRSARRSSCCASARSCGASARRRRRPRPTCSASGRSRSTAPRIA